MKSDKDQHSPEALDEEIAEVKSLMEKAFRAEAVPEKERADELSEELPDRLAQSTENGTRKAESADNGWDLLPKAKAEDLAFIFGNDPVLSDADGANAEDSAKMSDTSSHKDADAGNNRAENGDLEEIELRQDSPALKACEKKPISEMSPEELAAHIESFKKGGKKAGTAASYRAFGAAVSFLATLAAMIFLGYVCGQELAARTGAGWAMPACLVAGAVLGFVFGILVIRPLINERK